MVLESLMRPWVDAVETTSIGMGPVVANAAANASSSLKRRVDLSPDAEEALQSALDASNDLAKKLERVATVIEAREATLAALTALIDTLRDSRPSESTLALGLGW